MALFGLLFCSAHAGSFTPGNIAIVQADASANNTTASVIELLPATAGQSPSNIIAIDGVTLPNALRFSGSATSTMYIANSADGSLLALTGHNSATTGVNANTLTARGVASFNAAGTFALAATYTGASGQQTRGATTFDNTHWFIGDQNGLYTNGATAATTPANLRGVKAFGGTVYGLQASSTVTVVSTIASPTATSVTGLPGLTNNANAQDFYLVSSGNNGVFDVLYILSATSNTAGTINKYSLVSGSWTANGSFTTTFGGFGLAAAGNGSGGAYLYVSTGQGALTANNVLRLTDTAGYNTALAINTGNNVTLYTAPAGKIVKGVAFAPANYPDLTVSVSAPASAPVSTNFDYTITASNTGNADATGIAANFTIPAGLSFVTASGTNGFSGVNNSGVVNFTGGAITAGNSATLTVTVTTAVGATYTASAGAAVIDPAQAIVESFEGNNSSPVAAATDVLVAPMITTQPTPTQIIASGTTTSLTVAASGYLPPTFQWYQGVSGDTSNPVGGATAATFVTPALTMTTSYWVRATNASGTADSNTAVVNVSSANANLAALALSPAILNPTFDPATITYTATVPFATMSVTVTPTLADATATVKVNGSPVISGNASDPIALNVGSNIITTVVTAQDMVTTKTYTVTVTRLGNNANLGSLALSAGTLNPAFDPATIGYTASVPNATASITVTPATADAGATVTVNGNTVASGNASAPIGLNVGSNIITTVVTAQDMTTTKTYTVTVTRQNNNANLSSLASSAGTLNPAFDPATIGYNVTVPNTATTIALTPATADAGATVTVGGNAVTSGNASAPIGLNVGFNPIAVVVTAQDPSVTKTYTVTVNRLNNVPVPFTPGNVVVYRIGTGTGSLLNTGAPVFLDEYTPGGVLVQSVALPTTASGPQNQLIASGTATSEGLFTRSANGKYLVLAGYARDLGGTGSLSGTASATVKRTVGLVDALGNIDTSTALNDFADANNPRSATSSNGTDIWVGGAAGGVRYAPIGAGSSTQISTTGTNIRSVYVFNGQLYCATASGTAFRIGPVGAGLPKTSGQTITNLPSFPLGGSPDTFFLADLSPAAPGLDTLYVADETNSSGVGGIQKYALVSGAWVAKGVVGVPADAYRGVTASISGSTVTLFATRKGGSAAAGGGELVSLVDNSGYNGTLTGTPTLIATAPANIAFRGVAPAPVAAPDLVINLTGPATAAVGADFSYTLTVGNSGGTDATGVDVQFTLPAGVTYSSATGAGFAVNQSAGVVTFTGGAIAASASATLTVSVTPAAPGTFTVPAWAAVVDPSNTIAEVDESNNNSPFPVTTLASFTPDLTVSYTGPAQAVKDIPFDYTITANNVGLADATGVTVQFTLPAGVAFSSGSGASFTVGNVGGVVTFSGGSIASGGSVTLTVSATASPSMPTSYTAAADAAVIDPANTIVESVETNNTSNGAITTTVRLFPLPVATDDSYTTTTNGTLTVGAALGLLANDSSPNLTFIVTSPPAHGTVMINPDGSFTYIPVAGYAGPDSFNYTVTDCVQLYKMAIPPLGVFGGATLTGGGYGSALAHVPGTTDEFYGLTDRGPNVDGATVGVLPIPDFTPSIQRFKLLNGQAVPQGSPITLKAPDGTHYSGRINSANDTGETFTDLNGNVLPLDPNGFDSEGMVALPDGTFWVSDEYGPFINHFDATGTELQRLSPMNGALPIELAHRIPNKGMEGLTITPDGTMLVGIMQGAIQQPDLGDTDATKIAPLRIVTYTLATGATHEYLCMLTDPNTNNKHGVSEITALSNTVFLVDERDNQFPPSASKKLFRVDISGATDVGPASTVAGAAYEAGGDQRGLLIGGQSIEAFVGTTGTADATAALATAGIAPVSKALHLDLGSVVGTLDPLGRFFAHDKIEGVAFANGGNTIYVVNDSDFGIAGVANTAPPYQLVQKTSSATPNVIDDGEILAVDLTRLPAATASATVTLFVAPSPDPVVYDGADTTAPVIADEQATPVDFGFLPVPDQTSRTFTIKNNGNAGLTGIAITIDGSNATDFSVTTDPATSVAVGDTTTFIVRFQPLGGGPRSAALHIASNAPGAKASYDFPLAGAANTSPIVAADHASVIGNTNSAITNTGTFGDADGDTVTLTASVGTVTKHPGGTWSWSVTSAVDALSVPVTITTDDGTGLVNATASTIFTYTSHTAGLAGNYVALLTGANGTASLQVKLTSGHRISGYVRLPNRQRVRLPGTVIPASNTATLILSDGSSLTLSFDAFGHLVASLSGPSGVFSGNGDLAASAPASLVGHYAAIVETDNGAIGWLQMTVSSSGSVRIAGKLPDGTAVLSGQGTNLERDHQIAIMVLSSAPGHPQISGSATFADLATSDVSADALTWINASNQLQGVTLSGAIVAASSGTSLPLAIDRAGLNINGNVTLGSPSQFRPPVIGLSYSATTGRFNLNFRTSLPRGPIVRSSGVYQPKLGAGAGNFIYNGATGRVRIGTLP